MIRLRVDEAAAIPLAVESASPVSMTIKEEFIDRGGASIQSNKNATPGASAVEVTPDPGYDALAKVTVEAVPQGALSPIDIDFDDSTGAFTAEARVGTSGYIPNTAFVGGGFQLATQAAATITPSNVQRQAVAAHKYTTGAVVVDPIPSEYIIPSGTKNIVSNGDNQDVKAYEKVNVNVPNTYAAGDEGKVVSNGALVAKTSDTVTQNGVVDTTLIDELTVNVSGGGGNSVTGTFTIATIANNNFPTITHNLNTQKIAVLIYPLSNTVSADGGYQKFYSLLINANPIMQDDVSQWTFDWTGYNSKFSDVETQAIPITGQKLRIGTCHVSPWTTQNSWSVGGNPAVHLAYNGITITDNTVRIDGGGGGSKWAIGTYKYHVWKLG